MFSGKEAADPSYPTQWALNPNAYQNVDSSTVDWASLAQQWIAMKEAAAILATPSAPGKADAEEGEAPMEVENPDTGSDGVPPPGAEWNAATNSWVTPSWNQWGWGWGSSGVDPKIAADPAIAMAPMIDGYSVPSDGTAPMPGYTTGPTPTFQHGYWTAPQTDQQAGSRDSSRSRERRSKSKNRDHKPVRPRLLRDKPSLIPPVIEPIIAPMAAVPPTLDAAKRRQLPGWIREGLEKMEREKQRAIEREQEKKAREEAEKEKKRLEEEELERMKAVAGGQPIMPTKSKFESDSEGESDPEPPPAPDIKEESDGETSAGRGEPELAIKTKEEIMQEVMFTVRRSLTEILLEVTDSEINTVSQEELARYTAAQASRLNAMKASKSKALASIAVGLGLAAYGSSSSDDSDADEEPKDVSDQQLQDMIKRRKQEWERTARQIDADNDTDHTPDTPHRHRSSVTPPQEDRETPEKISERRTSKDKRAYKTNDRPDGIRRLDSIPEERTKRPVKNEHTPSPHKNNHKKESSSSTSDSDADSSTSSSNDSESEREVKVESKSKKRKRRSSSSSDSQKKSKKHKKEKSRKSDDKSSKSKHRDDYEKEKSKSKKRDNHDRRKSPRSRDYEKSHKEKYRDDSDDDRPRKRSKRSRSISYESRSGRRRSDRSRDKSEERSRRRDKRSYDRDSARRERSPSHSHSRGPRHDRHDRYDRSRDHERRHERSTSRSRHRR